MFSTAALSKALTFASEASAPAPLDSNRLDRIAAMISKNGVRELQVLNTAAGATLVGIGNDATTGSANFIVIERKGSAFKVLARGQLDNKNFRRGSWKAEKLDADGDDFDEVLFTGIRRSGRTSHHRFVLYVPRERQAYVLEIENSGRIGTPLKTVWSKNLLASKSADYRRVLKSRAKTSVARLRTR